MRAFVLVLKDSQNMSYHAGVGFSSLSGSVLVRSSWSVISVSFFYIYTKPIQIKVKICYFLKSFAFSHVSLQAKSPCKWNTFVPWILVETAIVLIFPFCKLQETSPKLCSPLWFKGSARLARQALPLNLRQSFSPRLSCHGQFISCGLYRKGKEWSQDLKSFSCSMQNLSITLQPYFFLDCFKCLVYMHTCRCLVKSIYSILS